MVKTTTNALVVRYLLKVLTGYDSFFRKLAMLPDQKKVKQEARIFGSTL